MEIHGKLTAIHVQKKRLLAEVVAAAFTAA